jgi:cytochrome c-type protein NapB
MKSKFFMTMAILAIVLIACKTQKKSTVESTEIKNIEQQANTEQAVSTPVETNENLIDQAELGLRKGNLIDEDEIFFPPITYSTAMPGTSENIDRSFENAPPMIPHTVDGFVPITAGANACLACHLPAAAAALKTTAMPVSHFINYRPELIEENGLVRVNAAESQVVAKDLGGSYSLARYNCTQCHVPQATATVFVDNQFKANFRTEEASKKSNQHETMGEGVK